MPDSYDLWTQLGNTNYEYLDYGFTDPIGNTNYEYLDYGFTDPTSYHELQDDFGVAQDYSGLAVDHADFIAHVSELPFDVEVGTTAKQYAEQYGVGYEYQDIHGNTLSTGDNTGISFLNMSEEEFDKLYAPTAEDQYLNKLAGMLQAAGQVTKAMDPMFGGPRDRRDRERFSAAQSGSIPGLGFGMSNMGATNTRFDAINRRNLDNLFGRVQRTGIDAQYVLNNIPRPSRVSIPSGSIGTTSGARRSYARTTTA